jgi:hypothetical protein
MKISEIKWIDEEALEALVIVSDGRNTCEAFSCPCKLTVGNNLTEPLATFNEGTIVRVDKQSQLIKKNDEKFGHELVGEVIDINKRLIKVGEMTFKTGPLPGDIEVGNYVQLFAARIDVE